MGAARNRNALTVLRPAGVELVENMSYAKYQCSNIGFASCVHDF